MLYGSNAYKPVKNKTKRALFFLVHKKKEGSGMKPSQFSSSKCTYMHLQELAQFSLKANPLPKRHRACPSVSLDKKVMYVFDL